VRWFWQIEPTKITFGAPPQKLQTVEG